MGGIYEFGLGQKQQVSLRFAQIASQQVSEGFVGGRKFILARLFLSAEVDEGDGAGGLAEEAGAEALKFFDGIGGEEAELGWCGRG